MNNSNLILLRCGKKSLHKKWINKNANYDLVLIPYEKINYINRLNCTVTETKKGQKWKPIYQYILENFKIILNYDFIMIPDDDLDISYDKLNKLFAQIKFDKPAISQPSLSHKSYYLHAITLNFPNLYARETSFVEIMTPIFNIEALISLFWTFNLNSSGWGLEPLWYKIIKNKKFSNCQSKLIIYDNISVTHTRPVGGQNRGINERDDTPNMELRKILREWNLSFSFKIHSLKVDKKNLYQLNWSFLNEKNFENYLVNSSKELVNITKSGVLQNSNLSRIEKELKSLLPRNLIKEVFKNREEFIFEKNINLDYT